MWKVITQKVRNKARYIYQRLHSPVKYYASLEDAAQLFPKFLSVAFTNQCNSNCVFCAYKYRTYKPTVIEEEVLEKACREYSALGGGMVGISSGLGDPLADPLFWEHLAMIRKYPGLSVPVMITNLIGARKLGVKRLALEGPTHIGVSIGGFDRETYRRTFGVDHFQDVMESMFMILEERKAAGKPLEVSVLCRSNVPWRKNLSSPEYKKLLTYIEVKDLVLQTNEYDNWGGLVSQKDLLPGMAMLKDIKDKKFPCIRLFDCLGINPDGTAVACACREANADTPLVVGNIKEHSLLELGRRVALLRRGWRQGRIPAYCQRCTAYFATKLSAGAPEILAELRERDALVKKATGAS